MYKRQLIVHILDLGHDATVQGFVFMPVVMVIGGKCNTGGCQEQGGNEMACFHEVFPFVSLCQIEKSKGFPLAAGHQALGILAAEQPEQRGGEEGIQPVSYTHLDVYKRQPTSRQSFQ